MCVDLSSQKPGHQARSTKDVSVPLRRMSVQLQQQCLEIQRSFKGRTEKPLCFLLSKTCNSCSEIAISCFQSCALENRVSCWTRLHRLGVAGTRLFPRLVIVTTSSPRTTLAQCCSCFLLFACPKRIENSELHLPLPIISCFVLLVLLCRGSAKCCRCRKTKVKTPIWCFRITKPTHRIESPKGLVFFFSQGNLAGNPQSYIQVPRPVKGFIVNAFYKIPSLLEIVPLGFPFMKLLIPSIQNLWCTFSRIPR